MTSLEFVGGKEACHILGVHQRTLYQWDAKKLIDTIRTPGNKRLYNVNKYIQGHISKNIIYNPIWMIISKDYNQVYYLMYCEKNVLIKLTAYELDLLDNFNKKNNCNLTWFYVNSKGESIKARFSK